MDDDEYKPLKLIEKTINILKAAFDLEYENNGYQYKKTLYNMNKKLVEELFAAIPSYENGKILKQEITSFQDSILRKMKLENKNFNSKNNIWSLPQGVMDIEDELNKLIQRLSVADYFFDREYEEVWDMDISAVVTAVRFSDSENVIAIVSGENKRKPVFCSKSFLVLLKSLEESKAVSTIWIAFSYEKFTMVVNYDAKAEDYIEIGILSNQRNFNKIQFDKVWEVLGKYEFTNDDTAITGLDEVNVS